MSEVIRANAELLPHRVEKVMRDRIESGTYKTLVVGTVFGEKSEVVAFGKLDDGRLPDADTVYEIGSVTKTFTATLLADAILSGRFRLETPVSDLLPDFKIPERNGKKITLGQIAMHRSSLPRIPANMMPKDPANPYADYDEEKLKAFLGAYEPSRDPGASFEYSNLAFGLLGYALAKSASTTYAALLDESVLQPLGMTMSGIEFNDEMLAHLAPGHGDAENPAKNWDLDVLAGAGAIRSSVNDMLRYLKANMGVNQTSLTAAMMLAQEPRGEMKKDVRIGLGWMSSTQGTIWHNGCTGGYCSFVAFSADRRRGVVILSSTSSIVDDLGFAVLDNDAPLEPVRQSITLPASSLEEFVGTYKLEDKFLLKIVRVDNQLYGRGTGQSAFRLFPWATNEFFAKIPGVSISFTRDTKQAVTGLVLHQNGNHVAPKMSDAELQTEQPEEQ